ncbi:MAG: hypothetical protein ABFS56_16860 [Pseudomonadota bacterium]
MPSPNRGNHKGLPLQNITAEGRGNPLWLPLLGDGIDYGGGVGGSTARFILTIKGIFI